MSTEWICIVCGGDCAKYRDVCVQCDAERTRSGRSTQRRGKTSWLFPDEVDWFQKDNQRVPFGSRPAPWTDSSDKENVKTGSTITQRSLTPTTKDEKMPVLPAIENRPPKKPGRLIQPPTAKPSQQNAFKTNAQSPSSKENNNQQLHQGLSSRNRKAAIARHTQPVLERFPIQSNISHESTSTAPSRRHENKLPSIPDRKSSAKSSKSALTVLSSNSTGSVKTSVTSSGNKSEKERSEPKPNMPPTTIRSNRQPLTKSDRRLSAKSSFSSMSNISSKSNSTLTSTKTSLSYSKVADKTTASSQSTGQNFPNKTHENRKGDSLKLNDDLRDKKETVRIVTDTNKQISGAQSVRRTESFKDKRNNDIKVMPVQATVPLRTSYRTSEAVGSWKTRAQDQSLKGESQVNKSVTKNSSPNRNRPNDSLVTPTVTNRNLKRDQDSIITRNTKEQMPGSPSLKKNRNSRDIRVQTTAASLHKAGGLPVRDTTSGSNLTDVNVIDDTKSHQINEKANILPGEIQPSKQSNHRLETENSSKVIHSSSKRLNQSWREATVTTNKEQSIVYSKSSKHPPTRALDTKNVNVPIRALDGQNTKVNNENSKFARSFLYGCDDNLPQLTNADKHGVDEISALREVDQNIYDDRAGEVISDWDTFETSDTSISYVHNFLPISPEWQVEKASQFDITVRYYHQCGEEKRFYSTSPPKFQLSVAPDGNCFFRAIAMVITGSEEDHIKLRKKITDHVAENADMYRSFLNSSGGVTRYVRRMRQPKRWATDIEIFATATLLKTVVEVYSPVPGAKQTEYCWQTFKPLNQPHIVDPVIYLSNINDHFEPVVDIDVNV